MPRKQSKGKRKKTNQSTSWSLEERKPRGMSIGYVTGDQERMLCITDSRKYDPAGLVIVHQGR